MNQAKRITPCIMIVMLVLLCGCGGNAQPANTVQEAHVDSADLIPIMPVPTEVGTVERQSPPLNGWQQVYKGLLLDENSFIHKEQYAYVQLSDLNLDGTPELLLAHLGAANSWIAKILSYEQGEITQYDLYESQSCFSLPGLYYHRESDGFKWLEIDMVKDGYGVYISAVNELCFDNLEQVTSRPLFYCEQRPNPDAELEFGPDASLYLDESGSRIPAEAAEKEIQGLMQGYCLATQTDFPLLWYTDFNAPDDYLRMWQPLGGGEFARIKRLSEIPVTWEEEHQFPGLLIQNLTRRDTAYILDGLDSLGEPIKVDIYGGFFDEGGFGKDDLVVAWYAHQKAVLARYNASNTYLAFLPDPDQKTLERLRE